MATEQLADLAALTAEGVYNNPCRGFGVKASISGETWYNWDIKGYLECACAGAFGVFEGDDDDDEDKVVAAFSWEDLVRIFECGRSYE